MRLSFIGISSNAAIDSLATTQRSMAHTWEEVKRARDKVGSTVRQLPGFRVISRKLYQRQMSAHRAQLPTLEADDYVILQALRDEGSYAIPIEALGLSLSEKFWQHSLKLVQELKRLPSDGQNCIGLSQDRLMAYPEIYLWGLETRLLNLIENYIGLPVLYHGCSMRRDIVNEDKSEVIRQWHIDNEGDRVIKLIIYFNDVGEGGGGYNYIPKQSTLKALRSLNYRSSYIKDEAMQKVLPKQHWRSCLGPKGTVIISDTGNLFHRAQPPVTEDRFSISFCYTSQKPRRHWVFDQVSPQQWKKVHEGLDESKKKYLINRNKFFSVKMLVR